jgi:hypothetical protein
MVLLHDGLVQLAFQETVQGREFLFLLFEQLSVQLFQVVDFGVQQLCFRGVINCGF